MIKIHGVLTVTRIKGRFGPFNVGKLTTEIGEFAIRERFLEEFDEGRYEGDFLISNISAAPYNAGSRLIIETRAFCKDYNLDDATALNSEDRDTITPPDPLESDSDKVSPPDDNPVEEPVSDSDSEDSNDLKKLFGTIDYTAKQVKLDPTVKRDILRKQAAALSNLGYEYKATQRVWEK